MKKKSLKKLCFCFVYFLHADIWSNFSTCICCMTGEFFFPVVAWFCLKICGVIGDTILFVLFWQLVIYYLSFVQMCITGPPRCFYFCGFIDFLSIRNRDFYLDLGCLKILTSIQKSVKADIHAMLKRPWVPKIRKIPIIDIKGKNNLY